MKTHKYILNKAVDQQNTESSQEKEDVTQVSRTGDESLLQEDQDELVDKLTVVDNQNTETIQEKEVDEASRTDDEALLQEDQDQPVALTRRPKRW